MNETMNARDIPAAIHWHEGLLLTPQHFQQLTSRHEALVQYSAAVYSPYCWGLRRFKHQGMNSAGLEILVITHNCINGIDSCVPISAGNRRLCLLKECRQIGCRASARN